MKIASDVTALVGNTPLVELNLIATETWTDLLSGKTYCSQDDTHLELAPYGCAWISNHA